ncbi:RDD family protein [Sinomicrobium soli]|uniref:RDD family protein n=1 Tax=Sinomicrobium sp. N-1-3-6 TaxID=2219864 RepID=UPI000DCC79DD|nr:RDD family protein [Sinomicrobium sp. N-1-3-6]RAV29698.1 RDD family protein [Sinomicrobium sp. N-1-3-6]
MLEKKSFIPEEVYASKGKRIGNLIIDRLVIYVFSFVLGMITFVMSDYMGVHGPLRFIENMNPFEEILFEVVITLLYYAVMESATGRTIGKFITNTRVINEQEEKATLNEAVVRSLCRLIPFEAFSFLGGEGRGWHDSIPKTYVVDIRKYEEEKQIREGLETLGNNTEAL